MKSDNCYKSAVLKKNLKKGCIISIKDDLVFQKTNLKGLYYSEIEQLLVDKYILKENLNIGQILQKSHFKLARIGVVIVCRLGSSRLNNKALKKIGSITSIEYCIKNVLKLDSVDEIILATSTDENDSKLEIYTFDESVKFFQGSKEDVMKRILDASLFHNLDVVARVTADNPFISNEMFQICLDSHFMTGSDLSSIKGGPIGLTSRIVTVEALKRAKGYFPDAKYSEYLPFYFENNPKHFRVNNITCPKKFRRDYRLTLDYDIDLKFFNQINNNFKIDEFGKNYTQNLLEFLDKNPKIANINSTCDVVYRTNKSLLSQIKRYTTISDEY
jgi:spore coat polysaccharide biosynthesis protein SpsF (cytidylyltransferase family)